MAKRFRVLVIDDDPGIREYLHTVASRQGYEVYSAPDGETAIEGLAKSRPDIITLNSGFFHTVTRSTSGIPIT